MYKQLGTMMGIGLLVGLAVLFFTEDWADLAPNASILTVFAIAGLARSVPAVTLALVFAWANPPQARTETDPAAMTQAVETFDQAPLQPSVRT